jgi:hypothetical protein
MSPHPLQPSTIVGQRAVSAQRNAERRDLVYPEMGTSHEGLGRATGNDSAKIIVAALHADVFPYFFTGSQNQPKGIAAELLEAFARHMGIELAFDRRARNPDELFSLLVSGEAAILASRIVAPQLADMRAEYSPPYLIDRRDGKEELICFALPRRESKITTELRNFIEGRDARELVTKLVRHYTRVSAE